MKGRLVAVLLVSSCPSVPPEIKKFFVGELDKTKEKKRQRILQSQRADEVARTYYDQEQGDDYDAKIQATLHPSREEHEFKQRVGAWYDTGGRSGSSQRELQRSGPLPKMFARARSQAESRLETTILV
jgi:ribosomal protein L21E